MFGHFVYDFHRSKQYFHVVASFAKLNCFKLFVKKMSELSELHMLCCAYYYVVILLRVNILLCKLPNRFTRRRDLESFFSYKGFNT